MKSGRKSEPDTVEIARKNVGRLQKRLERLDRSKTATDDQRTKASTALTQATRLLARMTGGFDLGTAQILKAPAWKVVRQTLLEALGPHPEALEACIKALEELGQ